MDDDVRRSIDESLKRKHGDIVRLQNHDAPEWFGDGWLVSFEVPKRAGELMPVVRVAFFHNENGKAVLAKEFVVRDARRELSLVEVHRSEWRYLTISPYQCAPADTQRLVFLDRLVGFPCYSETDVSAALR